MTPRVTIGVACHNAEATIEAALRSAIAQDLAETEIVVVDDASTDRSLQIVETIVREDARVRLISFGRNRGAAAAYNAVIDAARGRFVMLLDADDRALPARARVTATALEEFGAPALCFCDRYVGQEGGPIIRGLTRRSATPQAFETYMLDAICLHHAPDFYRANLRRFETLRAHGLGGSSAGSGVMTAPTNLLRRLRFDETLRRFSDTELNLRAAMSGVAAIGVAGPLAVQTVTGGAEKSNARRRRHTSGILAKHERVFRRHGVTYPGHHHGSRQAAPPIIARNPKATIGLLTFNCADTLPRAIESALRQTLGDVEIVILDDASSDATLDIARSYEDRRIRVLESPWNLGAGLNRNRLADEARGEFLAFFDDDDASHPGRVEAQIADLTAFARPAISIASAFRHHRGRLTEAHRSLGPHCDPVEAAEAERLVWRTILEHSEGGRLLAKSGEQQPRYALGTSLMCGAARIFRDLRFDPEMRRMQDLEFLARFARSGGCLIPMATPMVDVFVTPTPEKRWSRVVAHSSRLLEKHEGALERLFGLNSRELIDRNHANLPAIRAWEATRAAFGY